MATTTADIIGFQRPIGSLYIKSGKESEFNLLHEKCGRVYKSLVRKLKKKADNPYALAKYILAKESEKYINDDDDVNFSFNGVFFDYLNDIYYMNSRDFVFSRALTEDLSDIEQAYCFIYNCVNDIVDNLMIKNQLLSCLSDKEGTSCSLLLLLGYSPDTVKVIRVLQEKYANSIFNAVKKFIDDGEYVNFYNLTIFKDKVAQFVNLTKELIKKSADKEDKFSKVVNENLLKEQDDRPSGSKEDKEKFDKETEKKETSDEEPKEPEGTTKEKRGDEENIDEKKKSEEETKVSTTSKLSDYIETTKDFSFDKKELYVILDKNNDVLLITDNVYTANLIRYFNNDIAKAEGVIIKKVDFLCNFKVIKQEDKV